MVGLDDLSVGHGRLMTWQLTDASKEVAAEAGPAGPPSHNQELRLRQAEAGHASGRWPRRWHLSASVADTVDPAALQLALTEFVRRHDTLRSLFRRESDGAVRRYVLPASAVELKRSRGEWCGTEEKVLAALSRLADTVTDPWGWPGTAFAALTGGRESTLFLVSDHLHVDLYSHLLAADEINRLHRAHRESRAADLAEPGSFDAHAREDRKDDARPLDGTVEHWTRFARAMGGRLPAFPLDLGVPSTDAMPLFRRNIPLFDEETASAVELWCARHGGTVPAALMAASALSVRELGGGSTFGALVPMSTRPVPVQPSVGWYVSAVPVWFEAPAGTAFADVMRQARQSFRTSRCRQDAAVERVLAALPSHIAQDRTFWFSYADTRSTPGAEPPQVSNPRLTFNPSLGAGGDVWINRNPDGTHMHVRCPNTPQAVKTMHAYASGLRAHLLDAVGRGQGQPPQ
ncbi:condensation domain-containing protein [Streptomyces sedi]